MDTCRVDVTYRPLRVGWALDGQNIEACRQAARLNHTLWGGRFNPMLPVNRPTFARRLADAYRVDIVLPVGKTPEVKAFAESFPHLHNPFHGEGAFTGGPPWGTKANILDIHNLLSFAYQRREHRELQRSGARLYSWSPEDPLADMFLLHLGQYPSAAEIGIDYQAYLKDGARPKEIAIGPDVDPGIFSHPTIAYFSRHGLDRHFSVPAGGWDLPGFFHGTLGNAADFLTYWNIRAADIPLLFVDPAHSARYARLIPAWHKRMKVLLDQRRSTLPRQIAVWSLDHDTNRVRKPFEGLDLSHCSVSDDLWNGLNVVPPMMRFDTVSTLGIVTQEREHPRVSFALNDKPFANDVSFHTQHLVASVSFLGNPVFRDDLHTLRPPCIPELNEFFGRAMHTYDSIRVEPDGGVGVIIDAADVDSGLTAIPVAGLFERVFDLAGFQVSPSAGGLLTRQVITIMGGLQGCRPFKIPGVRRLLRQYGPTSHFTKPTALQLIGGKDPENLRGQFSDHKGLFIEQRPMAESLTPQAVLAYLVEKGVFRIGRALRCPHCRLEYWTSTDALSRQVRCELCGQTYDPARQLVAADWDYRRSGLFGLEKNAQGAVPVALTLQQLDANLSDLDDDAYSVSLDMREKTGTGSPCEIDFAWLISRSSGTTAILLGECKDRGPIALDEFEHDVDTLRRVADALSRQRLKAFPVLSKLSPFTPNEIAVAARLNDGGEPRAILLTDRELEPYHAYERTKKEFGLQHAHAGTPEGMAAVTHQIYFQSPPPQPAA